jgi:hypothetical protein
LGNNRAAVGEEVQAVETLEPAITNQGHECRERSNLEELENSILSRATNAVAATVFGGSVKLILGEFI